jgi:voltage-gated potassium channel
MYYIEGETQPDEFPNILSAFWWAIATLTTVGYGDVVPVTGLGKFISGIIALLGIGIVALPTGIISAGFKDRLDRKRRSPKKCPHCGEKHSQINLLKPQMICFLHLKLIVCNVFNKYI